MNDTLSSLVNTIDFNEELIALNKQYQKLSDIYDTYENLIEMLDNLDSGLEITCKNAEVQMYAKKVKILNKDLAIKELTKQMNSIYGEYNLTASKAREIYTFQKLGNVFQIRKIIKENETNQM